jgi:ABC-type enterochelin transport system permease subunit
MLRTLLLRGMTMRPLASLLPGLVLTALLTLLATLAARIDLLQAAGAWSYLSITMCAAWACRLDK